MKKAWVLTKLYLNSLYGFSGFAYDLKNDGKKAFKKIGLVALIVLSMSGTVAMFVALNIKMYDVLRPLNQQGIVITMVVVLASLMTLVFGMMGIIATYFVEKEGDIVLSMPIKSWHLLTAKFASNYVYEMILSLVIMATGVMVYGIKSGEGPLFYIVSILISLLVPAIPLTIGYLLVIPLMRAGSILRKKDFTMIASGILVMIFAFGIQYFSQIMVKAEKDPSMIISMLASENGLVTYAGKIYRPSIWATYGMTDSFSGSGLANLLLFIGISVVVVIALIRLLSGVYATSIEGSQEVTKKKKFSQGELRQNLKQKSSFSALLSREFKMMNREPVYVLNGPLVILMMPLILGFMVFLQKDEFSKQLVEIMKMENAQYFSTLGISAISVFLGVSVNITSTCISREGRAFEVLKAMPINASKYLLAKLAHGLIFGLFATVMCIAIGGFLLELPVINLLLAFIIAVLLMLPILMAGILMELTWPKLVWDNPQKAMKQNINGVVIIMGAMVVLPLLGLFLWNVVTAPMYGYLLLTVLPMVASIVIYRILMTYGVRRVSEIEV